MKLDKDARYAKTHEWARKEGDLIIVGVSDFAQSLLKDVVYVELPTEGTVFQKGDKAADIESVKAVEELKAPVSGEVVAVNNALEDSAEAINEDPYGEGWFMKIKPSKIEEFDELLSPEEYEKYVATLEH
ncbi:MAG: glycine cleavage system protein GcvH [Candidatus Gerdarchaeota archaeon]|nr:MAG: glycine cleavage system protein GcvH [Candidatus Gerdarchaeota archaeon]RLI68017.1 MAG: glycine cleavage system protein GcvH [Candidatus Gerdarchaeota archaeon]